MCVYRFLTYSVFINIGFNSPLLSAKWSQGSCRMESNQIFSDRTYDIRMTYLFCIFVLVNLGDAVTTYFSMTTGIGVESNPIALSMMDYVGFNTAYWLKLFWVVLGGLSLLVVYYYLLDRLSYAGKVVACFFIVFIAFFSYIVVSNTLIILRGL